MKKYLFISILFLSLSLVAQDYNSENDFQKYFMIKAGVNMIDSGGDWAPFDAVLRESPETAFTTPFYLGAEYRLSELLAVGLDFSINKWEKGDIIDKLILRDEVKYFGIDLTAKIYFDQYIFGWDWLDLYGSIGAGFFNVKGSDFVNSRKIERESAFAGVFGGGGVIWVTDWLGLNAEVLAKVAGQREPYTSNHFQYKAGLTFNLVDNDFDNDGVKDKYDKCVDVPGLKELDGCPDSDGDGINDFVDKCPELPGPKESQGCPDTDGDGVIDSNDDCPEIPGSASLNGCPDTDGDGISDAKDKCPEKVGPKENEGCPYLDSDGDTVLDIDDQCPGTPGPVSNNGCPEAPPAEILDQLNSYAKTILFDTGRASFQNESYQTLQSMLEIIKRYPASKFTIDGHTDSVGSTRSNQLLSERRANAVRDYLISGGISSERLSSRGFGESIPIDTNKTKAGKRNNRRVEVKLIN